MQNTILEICRDGLRYSQAGRCNYADHPHGQCVVSPDHRYQFVKIPKNISSWTQTFLVRHLSWSMGNFNGHNSRTTLVCLRDPVSRWVSGIVEYAYHHQPAFDFTTADRVLIDWIIDGMVFDAHTVPQTVYLDDLVSDDIVWFWADDEYEKQLLYYFANQNLLPPEFSQVDDCVNDFKNDHRTQFAKITNYNFLINLCQHNDNIQSRIKKFYLYDYQLIKSVGFFPN